MFAVEMSQSDIRCVTQRAAAQQSALICARRASSRIMVHQIVLQLDSWESKDRDALTLYLIDASVSAPLDSLLMKQLCGRAKHMLHTLTIRQLTQFKKIMRASIRQAEDATTQSSVDTTGKQRSDFELQFEAVTNEAIADILSFLLSKVPSPQQLISA